RAPDATLVELFLDMLAAERGAGANTLAAYRTDLDDLSSFLRAKRKDIAGAAIVGAASALSFPLRRRKTKRRSRRRARRAEARAHAAEGAVDRRGRRAAQGSAAAID